MRAVYFLIERFGFSYVVAAQAPVHIRRTRRPGERPGPPEMHLSNDANERTTILLVEDECLLRDMLEETLTEAGFAVLSAASGEEAASLLGGMSMPWALVTDINLGRARMDGWELARLVRHHDSGCGILYVSGDSTHRWV